LADEVQRYPFGLLDVLGMKGGRAPAVLSNTYQLTIPALRLLARQNVTFDANGNAATALNGSVDVTVPDGQTWLVTEALVNVTEQAAMTALGLNLQLRYGNSTISIAMQKFAGPYTAAAVDIVPFYFAEPIVLLPGDGFRGTLVNLAGVANASVNVIVRHGLA
jgi:hypothetical protein